MGNISPYIICHHIATHMHVHTYVLSFIFGHVNLQKLIICMSLQLNYFIYL